MKIFVPKPKETLLELGATEDQIKNLRPTMELSGPTATETLRNPNSWYMPKPREVPTVQHNHKVEGFDLEEMDGRQLVLLFSQLGIVSRKKNMSPEVRRSMIRLHLDEQVSRDAQAEKFDEKVDVVTPDNVTEPTSTHLGGGWYEVAFPDGTKVKAQGDDDVKAAILEWQEAQADDETDEDGDDVATDPPTEDGQ